MIDSRFYMVRPPLALGEIVKITDTTIPTPSHTEKTFSGLAALDTASGNEIACLHNSKYLDQLETTRAGACFIQPEYASLLPDSVTGLLTPTPYRAFGLLAQAFYPEVDRHFEVQVQPIHPTAEIDPSCIIEYGAVIHSGAVIGKGTRIGSNTVIGSGVRIGENCVIEAGVTITHSIIGNDVLIFSGARLGQAGFGFFMDEKGHVKVPQLGRVIIEDDVEIGANTTIDRGSMKDTVVGKGCRIDNLVQIAHNVVLGNGCVIVSQVGIAGSTRLGNHVIAAGQVGITGHLKIGNLVKIAAQSGVMRDIGDGETVAGSPAVPVKQWHRQTVAIQKLAKRKEN